MHLNPGSWAILIANILIPIAILCFSSGFFPYKPLLPGFANFESDDGEGRPPVIFDKVIFMVVDALRRYGKATDCHHIFLVDTRYQ